MTVTDQIKIINRKIKQNESQYDLDREAAKISAFSANNQDKYELLPGEDLNLKSSTVEIYCRTLSLKFASKIYLHDLTLQKA